jgi:hypothetical protein
MNPRSRLGTRTKIRSTWATASERALDIYADLFDEDLDAVSDALDHVVSLANVPKMFPRAWSEQ